MFELIEQAICSGGPEAGLNLLIQKLEEEKNYPLLFEARMMQKRHALGLPLVQIGAIDDVPEDKRAAYERAFSESARETGSLFLADGQIPRAWPYFRAIGDGAPVAAAIEKLAAPHEELDRIIEIALEERVNPRKGFQLMLAHFGICRAITYFEQYPDLKTREECIALLVRTLHDELVENLKRAITQREGSAPDTQNIPALIAGREWLFGDMDYYADTSHVIAVIRFALDLHDSDALRLALEICEYGGHLSPQFKYRVDPPFENVYPDHALYIQALLGENVDAAIEHFGAGPPQVHVALLVRLKRYREALEYSIKHLGDVPPEQLACPSVLQLCELSGDYDLFRKLARERGDLLSFVAANFRPQSP